MTDKKDNKASLPMLVALMMAGLIAAFSESMMNVALPGIMDEFGVDSVSAQWLATGYLIIGANMVAVTAFLMRRFRLRTLFLSACVLFIVGAAVAMVAPNYPVLLIFRLIQACGTGVFIAIMTSTILVVAPKEKLGSYMAIGGACISMGPALAPMVSGVMVTAFGWRAVFLPPGIIMLIAAILGVIFIKNVTEPQKVTLDVPSLIMSVAGLALFMYGLARILDDTLRCAICIVVGVIIIVIFVRRQKKLDTPLLNIGPVRYTRFVIGGLITFFGMMIPFANSICGPLYYENGLELSALLVGVFFLLAACTTAICAIPAGRIMDKHGEWPLLPAGMFAMAVGLVMVIIGIRTGYIVVAVIGGMVISGASGFIFMPGQTAGLRHLPQEMSNDGVSILNVFIQIGACLGGTLFVGVMSSSASMSHAANPVAAMCDGFTVSMVLAIVLTLIGTVVAVRFALNCRKEKLAAAAEAPADAE